MLASQSLEIGHRDSWQLARALDRPSLSLLRDVVSRMEREEVAEQPQDPEQATSAPEPSGELLRADFSWPTDRVLRRIRALAPIPGLALELEGVRFFVTRAAARDNYLEALRPGEAAESSGEVVIRTGDGAISIQSAISAADGEPLDLKELAERIASHYRPV